MLCNYFLTHQFKHVLGAQNNFLFEMVLLSKPLVKSGYQNVNFLISEPKNMLWVLKRNVSLRRFF